MSRIYIVSMVMTGDLSGENIVKVFKAIVATNIVWSFGPLKGHFP